MGILVGGACVHPAAAVADQGYRDSSTPAALLCKIASLQSSESHSNAQSVTGQEMVHIAPYDTRCQQ